MATDPTGRISHVQDMHRGLTWKPACRVATTATITISTALNNGDAIDGVTLATGDRVLVKDQSTASQNGIYIVGATPTRAADMDQDTTTTTIPAEEIAGAVVFVISGTVNTKTIWYTTNAVGGTVGSTSIVWSQFTGGVGTAFATPSIVLGTSAAAGAATTVIRSDSTIAAFDATAPVTQAFSDVAATGSAAFAARRDHKHGMPASPSGTGQILIADTHSTPLVFGDLLQTEAQDDLLYADT